MADLSARTAWVRDYCKVTRPTAKRRFRTIKAGHFRSYHNAMQQMRMDERVLHLRERAESAPASAVRRVHSVEHGEEAARSSGSELPVSVLPARSGAVRSGVPLRLPGVSSSVQLPRQARYWIATIPRDSWEPCLPEGACWCIGQPELGETGYRHWQFLVAFPKKVSLATLRGCLPPGHYEPTRSSAAESYCQKEQTRDGEPFEFGSRLMRRNSAHDWDAVRVSAIAGRFEEIPSDIFIRCYGALRR